MVWSLFFSVFGLIFLIELPDKTAFATLLMATRGRPGAVFLGVAAAFFIQSLVAVAGGRMIAALPAMWVDAAAGILFLAFAFLAFRAKDEEEAAGSTDICGSASAVAWKSFLVIFIAEWGDLTQLATASLAAQHPDEVPTVFIAATLALWCVTALAILLGSRARRWIKPGPLRRACAYLFVVLGAYFLWMAYRAR